ncbi:MAG: hypothetical protein WBV70_04460 [Candidatus Bathyarchaeia archaeon]
MKIKIEPKEAEQIREAFQVQRQVLVEKLESLKALERDLKRIKAESVHDPSVILRENYEEKKTLFLSELGNCEPAYAIAHYAELGRKIDTIECLAAKYDYVLNGPAHKGRWPNRTKPLLFT